MAEAGLARKLPRAEADMVLAPPRRPRMRRAPARLGAPRVRCLALERLLGPPRVGDRLQARRVSARPHRARPPSVSRSGPQAAAGGSRDALTARRWGPPGLTSRPATLTLDPPIRF